MRTGNLRAISTMLIAVLGILFLFHPLPLQSQTLDRTRIPHPAKPPVLRVPAWTKTTLGSGAPLIVSEKHGLPLISFSISILGGSAQYESADRRGLADLTAAMMMEGTKSRDGDALSEALQLLGARVNIVIGSEAGTLSFVSTSDTFARTLDILADILLNPTFPADALERLRAQRLVALNQAKAQPSSVSSRVFSRILYGDSHPYGQQPTENSYKKISREEIIAFHKNYFQPGRALIVVTGDVSGVRIKSVIEKALAGWTANGTPPGFNYPPLPAPRPASIYLVDKAGAAQSTVALGNPGPPRSTPDYYAIQVMNTMLGGLFQSRLNANIREEKGYSYGVRSNFGYGKGPGAFQSGGDVQSAKTDAALIEFVKEFRGIGGSRPVTDEELSTAKNALIQRLPSMFASVSAVNSAIADLWLQGLPDDYYQRYGKEIEAVTKSDVERVAKQYIDLSHLNIVIVGDRAAIEGPLKATGIGPIVLMDIDGNFISGP